MNVSKMATVCENTVGLQAKNIVEIITIKLS